MSRMSQWMFFARSSGVDREVGRMIQRITRETTRGLSVDERERRVWRKAGKVLVAGWRDKRWIAQTGILMDKACSEEGQETSTTPWKCKEKGLWTTVRFPK
jgi:hypothetical protein